MTLQNQATRSKAFLSVLVGLHVTKLRFFLLVLFKQFFFFFFMTPAEKRAFSRLNAVISAEFTKKKEPVKRTAILRHVNWLFLARAQAK